MAISERVKTLLDKSSGSVFRRIDLHVHTPASKDMDKKWADSKPNELVEFAVAKGLDAIGITDHNSVSWCERVREAAESSQLTVFPGVEISTSEGHILALFDPGVEMHILHELLVEVGITAKKIGDLEAISSLNLTEVAAAVVRKGGLAIAAHVDAKKGFLKMVTSGPRRKAIYSDPMIAAFEVVVGTPTFSGKGYERRVPVVQGSDSWRGKGPHHELDAVGERCSLVAIEEISLDGLSQALNDPEIRLCLPGSERPKPAQVLEGMWVEGGFLNDQQLRFNDHISCLIGGTGSGKSLSLELIRFALDQQVIEDVLPQIRQEVQQLLSSALEGDCTVSLLIRKNDARYVVRRSWLDDQPMDPLVLVESADGFEEPPDPISIRSLFPIRAFSQSEIIEYSRRPLARLALVDELIDHSSDTDLIAQTKRMLRSNAHDLVEQWDRRRDILDELEELEGTKKEIEALEKFTQHRDVRAFEKWKKEQRHIKKARRSFAEFVEEVKATPVTPRQLIKEGDFVDTPSPDTVHRLHELSEEIRKVVGEHQHDLIGRLETFSDALSSIELEWGHRFDAAEAKYKKALERIDESVPGTAAAEKQLSRLRERRSALEDLETEMREQIDPRESDLLEARDDLLDDLQRARSSIRERRVRKAKQLTTTLNDQVRLKIASQQHSEPFVAALRDLRTGSRIVEKDIVQMGESLHPVKFVKSMMSKSFDELGEVSSLDPSLFERLHSTIETEDKWEELLALQITDVEDIVEVQFAVEANNYRDLSSLAHGQKCTVVLMIAMAEGSTPLIVDQPEDALHAPWIEDYIVSGLRRRRGGRQYLFATRSANVVVSSDAEQVIAMKADALQGKVDKSGGLDSYATRELVLYHVEGGEEAFVRRRDKYGVR